MEWIFAAEAARELTVRLEDLGWNDFFRAKWNSVEPSTETPARVTSQHRELWEVVGEFGEGRAEASGKLRLRAAAGEDWPAVGDWVSVGGDPAQGLVVSSVLSRRTQISRKLAGKQVAEQVLAANVDTIFLVMGLDGDYQPRRVERYLAQTWESGARAVVLLNKADLFEDAKVRADEIRRIALGVEVLCVSAATGQGMSGVERYLASGETVVLLGSSGVGKSTLLNRLVGVEKQATAQVRERDSRGRHTTTAKQLFFFAGGAMVIDTPGLRELQLWEPGDGITQAFGDIAVLAMQCRFRNCTHNGEPGCAVAKAIGEGTLEEARLENHRKLLREQAFLERKMDKGTKAKNREQMKVLHRAVRQMYRQRDKGK